MRGEGKYNMLFWSEDLFISLFYLGTKFGVYFSSGDDLLVIFSGVKGVPVGRGCVVQYIRQPLGSSSNRKTNPFLKTR